MEKRKYDILRHAWAPCHKLGDGLQNGIGEGNSSFKYPFKVGHKRFMLKGGGQITNSEIEVTLLMTWYHYIFSHAVV